MSDGPEPSLLGVLKQALPYLPGLAGAALSMMFGENLTARGKAMSLAIGVASALFVAPGAAALLRLVWPGGVLPPEMLSFVGFACGLFGMTACAGLMQWVAKWARNPLGMVKFKLGPLDIDGSRG
ncbi:MAG: hypothetical protein U1A07_19140 [Phenylobacterium sp.]|nr:hypothetical protein [Phenylobacterium sp.]MDZ4320924.1 hypothetical protein [Phenylobacterium sp.]